MLRISWTSVLCWIWTLRVPAHPGRRQRCCVWGSCGSLGAAEDTEPREIKTDALFLTMFNSGVTLLINPTNDPHNFSCFLFLALLRSSCSWWFITPLLTAFSSQLLHHLILIFSWFHPHIPSGGSVHQPLHVQFNIQAVVVLFPFL